jgi:hypothetical protein
MAASASSLLPTPGDIGGPGKETESIQQVDNEGVLVSFRGRLSLCNTDLEVWVLTDHLTHETVRLEGQHFELIEVDDSAAVMEIDDLGIEVRTTDVAELFQNLLFIARTGERFLQKEAASGKVVTVLFENKLAKRVLAFVQFTIGVGIAWVDLTASAFLVPRAGNQRLFFNLFDLYKSLGLTTFSGQASKWVFQSRKSWNSFFEDLGMTSLLVFSSHNNNSDANREARPCYERCLPTPSCSSMGLLALLLRFANFFEERGGLEGPDQRAMARMLLRKFLEKSYMSPTYLEIPLSLENKWKCRWPAPCLALLDNQVSFKLYITKHGRCSLVGLKTSVSAGNKVAKTWYSSIIRWCHVQESVNSIPLCDLLTGIIGRAETSGLLGQLLWHLSINLEKNLGGQEKSSSSDGHVVRFKCTTFEDAIDGSANSLDRLLAQYVFANAEHSIDHPTFSMATYGGNIGALPLQMSFIVFPDGVAALCCPAVLVHRT